MAQLSGLVSESQPQRVKAIAGALLELSGLVSESQPQR